MSNQHYKTEAAWSNAYDLTEGTNYKVNIWLDSITIEQTRVTGYYYNTGAWKSAQENRNPNRNGETTVQTKLGKIERNQSNIEALERCKTLDDIFSVFGYAD